MVLGYRSPRNEAARILYSMLYYKHILQMKNQLQDFFLLYIGKYNILFRCSSWVICHVTIDKLDLKTANGSLL